MLSAAIIDSNLCIPRSLCLRLKGKWWQLADSRSASVLWRDPDPLGAIAILLIEAMRTWQRLC